MRVGTAVSTAALVAVVMSVAACAAGVRDRTPHPRLGVTTASATPPAPPRSSESASTPPPPPRTDPPRPRNDRAHDARTAIDRLIRARPPGSVSVAGIDTVTGTAFAAGARGGIWTASVAKLDILETLLLRAQDAGVGLSADEHSAATLMIENSNNASADQLFLDEGEGAGMTAANARLGLRHTTVGPGIYWGLTTTGARDQLALLRTLVGPGLLHAKSRRYVRGLMSNVEADQRWGVSAAGDPDRPAISKDGWLSVFDDADLWAVGSVGIVTVDGHILLLAVLTQHNMSMEEGVELVERLARLSATATRHSRRP